LGLFSLTSLGKSYINRLGSDKVLRQWHVRIKSVYLELLISRNKTHSELHDPHLHNTSVGGMDQELMTIQALAEGMANPESDPEKLIIQYAVPTPEKPVKTCISKDTLESILIPRTRTRGML